MKLLVLVFMILFIGCSSGDNTTIGNPLVSLNVAPYATPQAFSKVTPFAVSALQLCVKRLRFKVDDEDITNPIPEDDEDNVDVSLGLVNINPSGLFLTEVEVPPGQYSRIEFDLEPDCAVGLSPSVILDNDNDLGTPFESQDDITIRFNGLINLSTSTRINLNIQSMIDALSAVTNADEIEDVLEDLNNEGDFDEDDEED